MKPSHTIVVAALSAVLVSFPAHASTLTPSQVSAIIGLLRSFNADASVIANVQNTLGGQSLSPQSSPSSCLTLTANLSQGFTDATTQEQVSKLQLFLGITPTTGYFGVRTQAAVQSWQRSHNIVQSGTPASTGWGVVGPQTRAAMATCNQTTNSAPSPSATGTSSPIAASPIANPSKPTVPPAIPPVYSGGGGGGGGGDSAPTPPVVPSPTPTCAGWPGTIGGTLQQAVAAYSCVEVQPGTYTLSSGVVLESGHTLRGSGQDLTIVKADPAAWSFGIADAIVSHELIYNTNATIATVNLAAVTGIHVSGLTLDGSGVATYGILADGMAVDHVTVRNARCSAIGIHGPGTSFTNSIFDGSARTTTVPGRGAINCASVPDGVSASSYGGVALGAAISAVGYPGDRDWAPDIENNTIENSVGPGLDIYEINGGKVLNNTIANNSGWAGLSLFGSSGWQIRNNIISQPAGQPAQPYHPHCNGGPIGNNSAAIFLCQDEYAQNDGVTTTNNAITGNQVSSGYGILSIGASVLNPSWVPFANTFESNNPYGSFYGCADNNNPGTAPGGDNTWTGNFCAGPSTVAPPTYF
jgi:peptidoglycan hydrolase-like protein with peptidoglycan-binding domain